MVRLHLRFDLILFLFIDLFYFFISRKDWILTAVCSFETIAKSGFFEVMHEAEFTPCCEM